MHIHRKLGHVTALTAIMGGALFLQNCSSTADGVPDVCAGLDVNVESSAAVKAFAEAATKLSVRVNALNKQFLDACNAINKELNLPIGKDAAEACGTVKKRIDQARAAGVTVTIAVDARCDIDAKVETDCQLRCKANVACDLNLKCEPGHLYGKCDATCSGKCEVTEPTFACTGQCYGTCTYDAPSVSCTGECVGSCDAPKWDGYCEAGCTATFRGECQGSCTGKCDGATSSGATCAGKCEGTCSAKANGHCEAKCVGSYKGGSCTGTCTGSCRAAGGVDCKGKCDGRCTYTPGSAKCTGTCRGDCTVKYQEPKCDGKVSCEVDAKCQSSCHAKAQASIDCPPPKVTVLVAGDAKLFAALDKHWGELAQAVLMWKPVGEAVGELVVKTGPALQAVVAASASAAQCMVTELGVLAQVSATVDINVSASASVSGSASGG